jgi:glutaredoxin-related protein
VISIATSLKQRQILNYYDQLCDRSANFGDHLASVFRINYEYNPMLGSVINFKHFKKKYNWKNGKKNSEYSKLVETVLIQNQNIIDQINATSDKEEKKKLITA